MDGAWGAPQKGQVDFIVLPSVSKKDSKMDSKVEVVSATKFAHSENKSPHYSYCYNNKKRLCWFYVKNMEIAKRKRSSKYKVQNTKVVLLLLMVTNDGDCLSV